MKRFTALALALILLLPLVPFSAAAAEKDKDKDDAFNGITIEFAVGDSTLKINGEDLTVETPYVVDGTTLVPLRVITEAFGAAVEWEGTTKTVTITYKGVEVECSIGSKTVTVNGEKSKLLAAPELTNNTTMVPLRFITETFGADVSYDEETKHITVKKEILESNSIMDYAMILKRSKKERLGDSFYTWSIKRAENMDLGYRSFNGSYSVLRVFDRTTISIDILEPEDGEDTLDQLYDILKNYSSGFTVMNLEKNKTPSGIEYASLEYKSSDGYTCDRYYIGTNYIFGAILQTDLTGGIRQYHQMLELFDTFDLVFGDETAEDLSDLDDETGLRIFCSDDMAIQMAIPGGFSDLSNSDAGNEFRFYENNRDNFMLSSTVAIEVYSSYEGHNHGDWAEKDLNGNKGALNRNYAVFSGISPIIVDGKDALYYLQKVTYRSVSTLRKDIFIDAGEYFYNISIQLQADENAETLMDQLIDSIQIGEIDKDEIGKMMRTYDPFEIKYKEFTEKLYNLTVSVPAHWYDQSDSPGDLSFFDWTNMTGFFVSAIDLSTMQQSSSLRQSSEEIYKTFCNRNDIDVINKIAQKPISGLMAYGFSYQTKADGSDNYVNTEIMMMQKGDVLFLLSFSALELYWGAETDKILEHILSSITFES